MKVINKKVMASIMATGMLFSTSMSVVQADTTDTNSFNVKTNISAPNKSTIIPVASNGNQTLKEVASANNVSLDILEKLNNNLNADEVIPNGTPLYLPQNKNLSYLFVSLATAHTGITKAQYKKYYGKLSAAERAAKLWIAKRESGYNYHARNGRYIGRFQLTNTYLHGDYSVANQERTADRYVKSRYGSWVAAKRFWQAHNWY